MEERTLGSIKSALDVFRMKICRGVSWSQKNLSLNVRFTIFLNSLDSSVPLPRGSDPNSDLPGCHFEVIDLPPSIFPSFLRELLELEARDLHPS